MTETADIIVVGGGLSGLLCALALSDNEHGAGRNVVLVEAGPLDRDTSDGRVTALAPSAMRMMARLGLRDLPTTPMTGMRVGEGDADTPWQFELPEREGQPLAMNVENGVLRDALLAEVRKRGIKTHEGVRVLDLSTRGQAVLTLDDGSTLQAALVVAADGRDSALRRLAGIGASRRDFGQSALVTSVTHAEPHEGIALQRFQPVGAVASLPLADAGGRHRSQIVWSDRPDAVDAARELPEAALAALIDERLWGALDMTGLDAEVQTYPLTGLRSDALSKDRVALVGDAARLIHPLAGQGWNLAVRDVAALAQGVREAVETGQDIGKAGLLGYERWRRADETALATLTTALAAAPSRGPLSIIGHARRAAFAAVDEMPSLHAIIRREAAGETGERPPLLR